MRLNKKTQYAGKVDEQIIPFVTTYSNERQAPIILSFYGWDGSKRKTLRETGEEFNLTRERVRQIVAMFDKKVAVVKARLPKFDDAVKKLQKELPLTEEEFKSKTVDLAITDKPFDHTALSSYARLVGIEVPWSLLNVNDEIIVAPGVVNKNTFKRLYRYAHNQVTMKGCCNLASVRNYLNELNVGKKLSDLLLQYLSKTPAFCWLDKETSLFGFSDIKLYRCRAINQIRKVFSVTDKIQPSMMRTCINRPHRMEGLHLSKNQIIQVCIGYDLASFDGNYLCAARNYDKEEFLSDSELAMVSIINEIGTPFQSSALYKICVAKNNMGHMIFQKNLSDSPIFVRLVAGLYKLIGQEIPSGSVKQMQEDMAKDRGNKLLLNHGKNAKGKLWIAYRVNDNTIRTGVLTLPARLKHLISNKKWKLKIEEDRLINIGSNEQQIYGFLPLFNSGIAEIDNILIIEFVNQGEIRYFLTDKHGLEEYKAS